MDELIVQSLSGADLLHGFCYPGLPGARLFGLGEVEQVGSLPLLFAFLGERTGAILIIGNLILLGFGYALFSSPNTNAVMGSVEKRFYGVASGILGTMRTTGMSFSMGTTMLIFSLYMGRTQITPAIYPLFIRSARIAFVFFTVLCLAGLFASLQRDHRRGLTKERVV